MFAFAQLLKIAPRGKANSTRSKKLPKIESNAEWAVEKEKRAVSKYMIKEDSMRRRHEEEELK